jgi:hypothetical protein
MLLHQSPQQQQTMLAMARKQHSSTAPAHHLSSPVVALPARRRFFHIKQMQPLQLPSLPSCALQQLDLHMGHHWKPALLQQHSWPL